MANSDKNIVITPNNGSSTDDPKIVFTGANTAGAYPITLKAYPTSNGSLSFEGSAGQLFSITNSLTGTIYSVNDVSGIPSIEVLDTGAVKLAQYNGNVILGSGTDAGYKFQITAPSNGSKLFKATYPGGVPLYGYADGSGSGITNTDPYSSGALVYMVGNDTRIYSGSTVGLTVTSSYAYGNSSLRAPIFYDTDNTNYYVDPYSTSRMNIVTPSLMYRASHNSGYLVGGYNNVGGSEGQTSPIYGIGTSYLPNNTDLGNMYGIGFTSSASFLPSGNSGWGLYVAANGSARVFLDASAGRVISTGDHRATQFYDYDNTGYYVDPASTSNMNYVQGVSYSTNAQGNPNISDTFYCGNWFRSAGQSGWYNQTYSAGIYATSTQYIQTYNSSSLQVNNNLYATGNITAYYSDKRLKNIIGNIPDALKKVLSLNGVYYTNNDKAKEFGYTSNDTQVGVIAQEVMNVLPEIIQPAPFDVGQNEDGTTYSKSGENYNTVQYEKLIPLLIEAIKEQQKQIEELKALIQPI